MTDFRSDTVTLPSTAMREAIFTAAVGDDVYLEDPTVRALEEKAASLFGMDAAIFCPSGTMTNQIAIKLHTAPLSEVICEEGSHVYLYEGGGIAYLSSSSTRLVKGDRGRMSSDQVGKSVNADDIHHPVTRLVSLENTANRGGGSCYDMNEILKIRQVCSEQGLALHLDGARLFNALVATGQKAREYGSVFDSISICLSKGLGAPVGSLLLGKKQFIKDARRIRKVFGGGMRQAGFLAAAGIYALDHNIERLELDHRRAARIGSVLGDLPYVDLLLEPQTNIVLFRLRPEVTRARFVGHMLQEGIRVGGYTSDSEWIRLVTHLGIDDEAINKTVRALQSFS
ncbi:MAG TPA: GntG family PLP-dependent aldolase [Bacteriovoracaceae bacterium]|nr:GntG family PLP-dependent aldolase [Bacteriovoracaceae bacterium]